LFVSDGPFLVFPRLLEGRGLNGEKVLKISHDITLNLERTSVFPETLLIRTFEDGSLVNNYVDGHVHNKHMYHDTKKMAAVIMKEADGVHVEGLLGHDFRIEPMPHLERSLDGHVAHMIHPVKQRVPYRGDHDLHCEKYFYTKNTNDVICIFRFFYSEGRSADAIYPEVHIFLDSSTCQAYNYNKTEITNYLSVMTIAANLRYRSVSHPSVKLVIVAITLVRVSTSEPYMTFYKDSKDMVLFGETLNKFMAYHRADREYKNADIYFLITGKNMSEWNGQTLESWVGGYAYLGTVCSQWKTGMCEDRPTSYYGAYVFTHELAHNLGCSHDESGPTDWVKGHIGSLDCPWSEGYLMSYKMQDERQYEFSYCCEREIRNLYNRPEFKCLRERNRPKSVHSIKSSKLPGDKTSLTNYCKRVYKYMKGMKADTTYANQQCKVNCRLPDNNYWILGVPDGTPCGKGNTHVSRC
ncbi:unnamed protein product, partial [Ixodes hexagonus]